MKRRRFLDTCLTLLLSLALAACAEDRESESFVSKDVLGFSASTTWNAPASSRADAAGQTGKTTFVEGDQLGVFACLLSDGQDMTSATPDFMYHQEVTKGGSAWTYSPLCYWPATGTLNFFAYCPFNNDAVTVSDKTAVGNPTLTFTQPATADVDLLGAESAVDCASRTSDQVKFTMRHLLAKVNFLFSNATSSSFTVQKVSFTVPSKGTFSYSYVDGLPQWTTESDGTTVTKSLDAAVEIPSGASDQVVSGFTSFLLPCSVSSVTISDADGNDKTYTPSTPVSIVAGKAYNMKFNAASSTVELAADDANCYMIAPPTDGATKSLVFTASDRINLFWGGYGYEDVADNTLSVGDDWTVDILWTDFTNTSDDLTVEKVEENGKCKVKATVTSALKDGGNAVVAVKKNDVILWSWHLWITDYDPKKDLANGHTVMDRNIGALSAGYQSDHKGVLYYQFGRKDPFLYATMNDKNARSTTDAVATSSDADGTDMAYAVNHPTIFINKESDKVYNSGWWTVNNKYNPAVSVDIIWQDPMASSGKKSLFDPSPAGWKVPEGDVLAESMTLDKRSNQCVLFNVNSSLGDTFVVSFPDHSSLSSGDGKPASGYGSEGNYWSSWQTKDGKAAGGTYYNKARFLNLDDKLTDLNTTNDRARGMTIRCMVDASTISGN